MQFSQRDLAVSAVLAAVKNDEDARAAVAAIAALPIGAFSDEGAQHNGLGSTIMKSPRPVIDRIWRFFRSFKTSAFVPLLKAGTIAPECLGALLAL